MIRLDRAEDLAALASCLRLAQQRPIDHEVTDGWADSDWECPGVYQLIGPACSYVGMSRNLRQRLRMHFAPGSPFSGLIVKARALSLFDPSISERDLRNAEAYWYQLLRPNLNRQPIAFVRQRG